MAFCAALFLLASPAAAAKAVIVLSMDGVGFKQLATIDPAFVTASSVTAVRPPFPSQTFPSHSTLATGVSPALHGVLANRPVKAERERGFDAADDRNESRRLLADKRGQRLRQLRVLARRCKGAMRAPFGPSQEPAPEDDDHRECDERCQSGERRCGRRVHLLDELKIERGAEEARCQHQEDRRDGYEADRERKAVQKPVHRISVWGQEADPA